MRTVHETIRLADELINTEVEVTGILYGGSGQFAQYLVDSPADFGGAQKLQMVVPQFTNRALECGLDPIIGSSIVFCSPAVVLGYLRRCGLHSSFALESIKRLTVRQRDRVFVIQL